MDHANEGADSPSQGGITWPMKVGSGIAAYPEVGGGGLVFGYVCRIIEKGGTVELGVGSWVRIVGYGKKLAEEFCLRSSQGWKYECVFVCVPGSSLLSV